MKIFLRLSLYILLIITWLRFLLLLIRCRLFLSFFLSVCREIIEEENRMAAAASSAGAAISSMITLMRKQSFRNDFAPLMDYNQEDPTGSNLEWMSKPWAKYIFRLTGLLSFISTCMNTPKSFELHSSLQYITFVIDISCAIVLTIEAAAKMKTRGVFVGDVAYLKDRWNHFDAVMVLSIYFSIILQVSPNLDISSSISFSVYCRLSN